MTTAQIEKRTVPGSDVLPAGFHLGGGLSVIRRLGGTRKADVYLCSSDATGSQLVCKTLRPESMSEKRAVDRLAREGRLLAKLSHPNVVVSHGFETDGQPRLVLEHLEGQDLQAALLGDQSAMPAVPDAVSVARQLCGALDHIHERGVLHLDVKPSNIMWRQGRVKLFDFSVAAEVTPGQDLKSRAGTYRYMSPEQARRDVVTPASDVFGLGVVLYRLLTGGVFPYQRVSETPSPGGNRVRRRLTYEESPLPPSALNPRVPRALDEVVLRAVCLDAGRRYHSGKALKAALDGAFQLIHTD